MEGKLSEKVDEPNELAKPREAQPAPEAVQRGAVIGDSSKQASWRATQQAHILEQDESATGLFYKPGESKLPTQKFELFDGDKISEPGLLASNIVPRHAEGDIINPVSRTEQSSRDNKIAQIWAVDYALERSKQQQIEHSHKIHDGHDATSNEEFLEMFLAGSGNDRQVHSARGDQMLEAFIKSPGAEAIRQQYVRNDNPEFTDKLGYGTVQAFKDTMLPHVGASGLELPDYSNPGVHVGGFGNPPKEYQPWAACTATRCDAEGKPTKQGEHVQFQVVNIAGQHSWFYHLPKAKDKPIGEQGERRTIVEIFRWTEPLTHTEK